MADLYTRLALTLAQEEIILTAESTRHVIALVVEWEQKHHLEDPELLRILTKSIEVVLTDFVRTQEPITGRPGWTREQCRFASILRTVQDPQPKRFDYTGEPKVFSLPEFIARKQC